MQNGRFRASCCSRDGHPVLVPVRLQHRYRRTRQVHLQVQQHEVTNQHQSTGARLTQIYKNKRNGNRDSDDRLRDLPEWLEEFTDRTQKCLCPQTLLRTQIRNVLRKWHRNQGSTVFTLSSQKTEIEKCVCEPNVQGLLAEDALAKQYLEQKKFGDVITADHKVLNEEGESRNNHQYAVMVQDFATQERRKKEFTKVSLAVTEA